MGAHIAGVEPTWSGCCEIVEEEAVKVTILNGNPDENNIAFEGYLDKLTYALNSYNHSVTIFRLRNMDIKYCTGCFRCWIETPGKCVEEDESGKICREYINSNFVLFASPVVMGFPDALLKKAQEMLLPLVHPYPIFSDNEIQHLSRYDKYPPVGLLLEKGEDTDDQDIEIITDIYQHHTFNSKDAFRFTKLTSDPLEEVVDEINRV